MYWILLTSQQARGLLEKSLAPRPSFNDSSPERKVKVAVLDGDEKSVRHEYHKTLRTPPSAYNRHVRFAVLEFDPLLDSSSINAKGWSKIVKVIEANYTLFDAFVILHGTDSLAYTCSAVSFMLQNLGKPVIFTYASIHPI
jgi:60kDa lysophospholipase